MLCYTKIDCLLYIAYSILLTQNMILLLPCATVKDKVQIPAVGDAAKLAPQMNKVRQNLRQYSNVEFLLKRIQQGEVIMTKKIQFDSYMKAQVDLMRGCVSISKPCPFQYASYMDAQKIVSTSGLSTKEQWAIEMIMSRYTINSIYHAAAYSNLEYIFTQTSNSYQKGYKNASKLITNLQISFKYFNQGYQPLKRLAQVYDTLQQLFTKNSKQQLDGIVEIKKQVFSSISFLVACNLAYLKLQKYRLMSEYRSCKELAYSVYNLIRDTKAVLTKSGLFDKIHPDVKVYLNIGELFFMAYALYFLLQEHEDMKNKQDYGFVKKQFQQMIVQNCVVCEQFIKIASKVSVFPGKQSLDNVMFADSLIQTMLKQVQRKQYAYGINIHENKQLQVPTLDQVIASRIGSRNLWECIAQF